MNSGIYGAVVGSLSAGSNLESMAHNLANVNTPGYRKDRTTFDTVLESTVLSVDYTVGEGKRTGRTFDLALSGDGFFVVNTPQGKAYTRQGNFQVDTNGKLVTVDGFEVLGNGAPIRITGGTASFGPDGKIFVEGIESGTIDVVDFPKPYDLRKAGSALFLPNSPDVVPQPATNTTVVQGTLEGSNVNSIEEMVLMIEATRSAEACQKLIQNYDQMIAKAVNELGKV